MDPRSQLVTAQAATLRDTGEMGPAPEPMVAKDMVRRSLPFIPVLLVAAAALWGTDGVASAAYAIAIVLVNLVLAAFMLSAAARISYAFLMGAALFGFLLRLGLVSIAVLAVKDASWVEPVALGLTLIVTHLALLLWELRHVSISLAYPGLKPSPKETNAR